MALVGGRNLLLSLSNTPHQSGSNTHPSHTPRCLRLKKRVSRTPLNLVFIWVPRPGRKNPLPPKSTNTKPPNLWLYPPPYPRQTKKSEKNLTTQARWFLFEMTSPNTLPNYPEILFRPIGAFCPFLKVPDLARQEAQARRLSTPSNPFFPQGLC